MLRPVTLGDFWCNRGGSKYEERSAAEQGSHQMNSGEQDLCDVLVPLKLVQKTVTDV